MKLIGFSPWKHAATSIPFSNKDSGLTYNIIGRPSSNSSTKRARSSYNQEKKNGKPSMNEHPDLVLTTDHQISILGHSSSRKSLKDSRTISDNDDVKELSQWIYTSRPGEQSSFLPKQSEQTTQVGAVVDANSRSVFSLQKGKRVVKIWSLDNEVTGPDEDEDSEMVERVDLPSPAVSMEAIPYRQQTRVKIKGHNSVDNGGGDIQGGVAGILGNGQMFVILITSSREVKIGFYGKDDASSSKSRRRSSSNGSKSNVEGSHIFSVATYSSSGSISSAVGQKRKADKVEINSESSGEITLTTLSLDPKNKDSIVFSKHIVSLLSSEAELLNGEKNKIVGAYSKESGKLNLPQDIYSPNGNGKSASKATKLVHVTQLDPTHVSIVYKEASNSFLTTIIDIRYGELISQPFPVVLKSPNTTVLEIGGLSTSILAVLTSDNVLSVYDVRRALILHKLDVSENFRENDENDQSDFQYGISTHWFSGTIGIIKKGTDTTKQADGNIQTSFARVGVFDEMEESKGNVTDSKQPLKGSYNLARAIASSMATTRGMDMGVVSSEFASLESSMTEWFGPDKNDKSSVDSEIEKILARLVKYSSNGGKQNGKKESLGLLFLDASKGLKSQDGMHQRFMDVLVTTAIKFAISQESSTAQKLDAAEVLMKCIKSGQFSGRKHFDKFQSIERDVLRSLLYSFKKLYSTDTDIPASPLNLIYHLLRYCDDSIPEHMLISMIHFVLCHVDDNEFRTHWNIYAETDDWYSCSSTKVLEKRLNTARSKLEEQETDELKDFIQSLENRLATAQKLFFIESIITHSKCNTTLLRAAMKKGLTQSDKGEVEVLMQVMSKLLRKAGKERRAGNEGDSQVPKASTYISKWLSALIDTNLGKLLSTTNEDDKQAGAIAATKKDVSTAVSQTQALLGLKQLLDQAQATLQNNATNTTTKTMDVAPLPLYGIESLTF
jgi:hypothetical protein